MKRLFIFLFIVCFAAVGFSGDKLQIDADHLSSLDDNLTFAYGNVIISYQDIVITSDNATYDRDSGLVELQGNVVFKDKDNFLRAEYIRVNLDSRDATIIKGKGFYAPYHYFSADKIDKVGNNSFILDNASISTCSDNCPDWSFSAHKAKIDFGKYFQAYNAFAEIKNVPFMYMPYFLWPIKKDRESGFLIPNIGFSQQKGFFVTPKYFWDIDVDKDATLGVNYYSNNGVHAITEFRYAKSMRENIHVAAEFINDRDSDANKDNRWRIFNIGNIYLRDNLELKINVDYVSDFRYKRDFEDYSLIEKTFLTDADKNEFINEFRLNYYSEYSDISIKYKDNMEYYDTSSGFVKNHLYRYPSITAEKYGIDLSYVKVDYLADYSNIKSTKYEYNAASDNSSAYEYQRYHSMVNIYKPVNLNLFTVTPFFTEYYTKWFDFNTELGTFNDSSHKLGKVSIDGDSAERFTYKLGYIIRLNEIYKHYSNFSHFIYNSFEYSQSPTLDHYTLPALIEDDLIAGSKLYSYTLTNYIKSKNYSLKHELKQEFDYSLDEDKVRPTINKMYYSYLKNIDVFLEDRYDFNKSQTDYFKYFISLNYNKFYFKSEYTFDVKLVDTDNTNMTLTLGGSFDKYDFEIYRKLSKRRGEISLDIGHLDGRETGLKFVYKTGCWNMGLNYKENSYDSITKDGYSTNKEKILFFLVELKGIGNGQKEVYSKR